MEKSSFSSCARFPFWISGSFLFFLFFLLSCSHDDDNKTSDPVSQLPAATQTGAGTFGCLINGQAFIHNDGVINCYYQLIDGGYYFGVQGKNRDKDPLSITLSTENATISEAQTLPLLTMESGNAWAGAFFKTTSSSGTLSVTNADYTGELHITKFDMQTRIVSGTFWFDVQHPVSGDRIEVRNGRFDCLFGT